MHNFTPLSGLLGGLLIGLAASLLLLLNGRIAGISQIAGQWPTAAKGDRLWRGLFLFGLVAGSAIWYYGLGGALPAERPHFPAWLLAFGGLLVGYGTSLSNGCTSGHGVCGIARLSPRSLVATLAFLVTGIVTAVIVRHVMGIY